MKVSYTSISTWMACHAKFAYKYRDGLRRAVPLSHFEPGTIAHEALAIILGAHFRGERLPDAETATRLGCQAARETRTLTSEAEDHADLVCAALKYHVPRMRLESWETVAFEGEPAIELALECEFAGARLVAHIDWIARNRITGKRWLMDHKTTKYRLQENSTIENNLQLAIYREVCERNGIFVGGALHHQISTTVPQDPKRLKTARKGRIFSVAKSQTTDWETYQNALLRAGEDPANYQDVREALEESVQRRPFRRWTPDVTTPTAHRALIDLAELAVGQMREVLDNGADALPSRDNEWTCGKCEHRSWCDAKLSGMDPRSLLRTVYRPTEDSPYFDAGDPSDMNAFRAHSARISGTGRYDRFGWDPSQG